MKSLGLFYKHYFEEVNCSEERKRLNQLDVSTVIGCCPVEDYFAFGNLDELCRVCANVGKRSFITNFNKVDVITPLVPFYVNGASVRRFVPLRGIYGPLPQVRPPRVVRVARTVVSNLSYYTPQNTDNEDNE